MIGSLRKLLTLAAFAVLFPVYSHAIISYETICERSNIPQSMRGDNPAFDDYDFRIRNQGTDGIINPIVNGIQENIYANVGCIEACVMNEVSEAYDGSIGAFIDYAEDISSLITDIRTTFVSGAIDEAKSRYEEIKCTAEKIAGTTARKTQGVEDAFLLAQEIQDYYFGVDGIKTAAARAREIKRQFTGVAAVDDALNREYEEQHRLIQKHVNDLPELRKVHEAQGDVYDAAGNLKLISGYIGEHTEKIASRMEEVQKVLNKINKALLKIQKQYCRHSIKDEKKNTPMPDILPLQDDMCDIYRKEENSYRSCVAGFMFEKNTLGIPYAQVVNPDDGCNEHRIKWNQSNANNRCKVIVGEEIKNAPKGEKIPLNPEDQDDGCNEFRIAHNEGKDLDGDDICIDPNEAPQSTSIPLGTPDEDADNDKKIEYDECLDPNFAKLLEIIQQLSRVAAALIVVQEVAELVEDVQKLQEYYEKTLNLWRSIAYVYQNANAAWTAIQTIYSAISVMNSFNFASLISLKNSMADSWKVLQDFAKHACVIWKEKREFQQTANSLKSLGQEIEGDINALKNFDPNVKDVYAVYKMWRELKKEDRADDAASRPRAAEPEESTLQGTIDNSQKALADASAEMGKKEEELSEEMDWWKKSHDYLANDIFGNENIEYVRNLGDFADKKASDMINKIPNVAQSTREALDAVWALEYEELTCIGEDGEYTNLDTILQKKINRLNEKKAQAYEYKDAIKTHTQEIEKLSRDIATMTDLEQIRLTQAAIRSHRAAIEVQVKNLETVTEEIKVLAQEIEDVRYMLEHPEEFDVDRNNSFCNGDDSLNSPNPEIKNLRKKLERKAVYACEVEHLVGRGTTETEEERKAREAAEKAAEEERKRKENEKACKPGADGKRDELTCMCTGDKCVKRPNACTRSEDGTINPANCSCNKDKDGNNILKTCKNISTNSCVGGLGIFDGIGSPQNKIIKNADGSDITNVESKLSADKRYTCDANKADLYWRESASIYGDLMGHGQSVQNLYNTFDNLNLDNVLQMVENLEEMIKQIQNIHNYIGQFEQLRDMIKDIDKVLERGIDNLKDAPKEIVECLKLDPEALAEEMISVVKDVIRDKISHELMYWFGYAGRDLAYMMLPDADYRPGDPLERWMNDIIFTPPNGGTGPAKDVSVIGHYNTTTTPDEALALMDGFESQLSDEARQFLRDVVTGQNEVYVNYMRKVGIDTKIPELSTHEDYELAAIFGSEHASIAMEDDVNWLETATAQSEQCPPDDAECVKNQLGKKGRNVCAPDDAECIQWQADKYSHQFKGRLNDMKNRQQQALRGFRGDINAPIGGEPLVISAGANGTNNIFPIKNKGSADGGWELEGVLDMSGIGEGLTAFAKPNIKEILKLPGIKSDEGGPYTEKSFGDDFKGKLYYPTPLSWNKCGFDGMDTFGLYYDVGTKFFIPYIIFTILPGCDNALVYKEPVAHVEIAPREYTSMLGNLSFLNTVGETPTGEMRANLEGIFSSKRHGTKWGSGGTNEGVMQARVWGISPIARTLSNVNPLYAPLTLACEVASEKEMDRDLWHYSSVPFMPMPIIGALSAITEPFLAMGKWRRDWFRPHAPMLGKATYPLASLYNTEEDRQRWNPRIRTCGGVRPDVSLGEDREAYEEATGVSFDKDRILRYSTDYLRDPLSDDVCMQREGDADNPFRPKFLCANKCSLNLEPNENDPNVCIGSWGALLPRTGQHITIDEKNPYKSMALLAYRAFDRALEYKYISPYKTAKGEGPSGKYSGPYGQGYQQWWMSIDWPYESKKFKVGADFDLSSLRNNNGQVEGTTGGMITTMWKETECCFRTTCDPHSWLPNFRVASAENMSTDPELLGLGPVLSVAASIVSGLTGLNDKSWEVTNYKHIR